MGLLKSFKKVLKSPVGKAALGIGAFMYGPQLFGAQSLGGGGGWGEAWGTFSQMPTWKKALIAGGTTAAAAAIGNEIEDEPEKIIDTSGHEGYLNSRKMFVDEWTQWLLDSDEDLSYEEARTQAENALFSKSKGGLIGLAQGGRIGMAQGPRPHGGDWEPGWLNRAVAEGERTRKMESKPNEGIEAWERANAEAISKGVKPSQYRDGPTLKNYFDSYLTKAGNTATAASFALLPWQKKTSLAADIRYLKYLDEQGVDTSAYNYIRNMDPKEYNVETSNKIGNIDPKRAPMPPSQLTGKDFFPQDRQNWGLTKEQMAGPTVSGDVGNFYRKDNPKGAINPETNMPFTNAEWDAFRAETVRDRGYETGREGPTWKQLGYPSEAAYLFSTSGGGGGGGGTGSTEGDYYGFKEWADWEGAPTTPLFGDATTYQGLLSKGGRIGLYGGGMGGMNNSMNPMMNRGLGAMGSPGMNPYNQQNLMQQTQMRGQPQGRPPMPGGPTTAQGPGITGTQAGAALANKEQDTELLQLIRMLASLGIPMEQLRGRTKEELVEMMISVKSRTQPEGRGEVVEEEQEEVMTAAHGGRVRAAVGYPDLDREYRRHRLVNEMEEEDEEIYIPKRIGRAMGSEQPIIPSRDGPQIDYRGIGGYQPHGAKEKKDDVRALLAQGEFVVTSDAVKGIGGGDRDVGAKRMYDLMHKYEPVGRALS